MANGQMRWSVTWNDDQATVTGQILQGVAIPLAVFAYEILPDGTPGEYQGIVDVNELQRIPEFTGSQLPLLGNAFCRQKLFTAVIPHGTDVKSVQDKVIQGLKLFSEAYLALQNSERIEIF